MMYTESKLVLFFFLLLPVSVKSLLGACHFVFEFGSYWKMGVGIGRSNQIVGPM